MAEGTSSCNANDTNASDSRVHTKNSNFNNKTSSPSTKQKNNKWGASRNKNSNMNPGALSFKGVNVDLRGNVFVKGPLQQAAMTKHTRTSWAT